MMLVMDRERRTLLLIGALSMAVCLALTAIAAHLVVASHKALLGWLVLMLVCLCMSAFAISWGGVPWVYLNDIFPMSVKEKAMSTSVFSQWVANFLIAYLVPQQVHLTSVPGTFAILRRVLRRRFRVGLCFRPGNEGFALGGDGQVVRRTTRRPRRVCSSNMLGFSVSVWLVCGWVSRVHWDMSWCLCLCVCRPTAASQLLLSHVWRWSFEARLPC